MIPNATDTVEVKSNIDGEVGQFTVDENSLAKIMSVLTNLYSDPEMAVVREYLTNALDAQIEAQENDPNYVWRPIDVMTPSAFTKEYKVRDYGIGMSVDDIRDIYSKYGKSTKESSNAVTGMLGLGSKCALTYTSQFTITGYKNGVRTRAVVSKDDQDIPVFMIVDTRATDEPDGVEISVPVRDRNSFAEKTKNFLMWWKPGQVLVNGQPPVTHDYPEVKKGVYLIDNARTYGDAPRSYVVMGNVPYAVDSTYVDKSLRDARMGFAAYVPMGAVDFPPSREVLYYNNRTKKVITDISNGLFEAVLNQKLDEIRNKKTHREAWLAWDALGYHFANHPTAKNMTYNGMPMPTNFSHPHLTLTWNWQGHGEINSRTYVNMASVMKPGALIVTGVTENSKPTSYFKKKVRHYINEKNITAPIALLVDKDIVSPWLTWVPRVDAKTIKDIKLPRTPSSNTPRAESPYDYYMMVNGKAEYFSDVNLSKEALARTIAYISPKDMVETYRKSGCNGEQLIQRLGDDYALVVMGKNRWEKFLRTYPQAITASEAFRQRITWLVNASSKEEYIVGQLGGSERSFLEQVNPAELHDPQLSKIAQITQNNKSVLPKYKQAENISIFIRKACIHLNVPERADMANVGITDRYPLIEYIGQREMKHMTIYVNAVYDQEYAPKP